MMVIGDFNKMFSALKSILNRVWDYIPWQSVPTRQRDLLSEYRRGIRREVQKTETKVRKRLSEDEKKLRLEQAKQKKLDKENRLSSRLLSQDEVSNLNNRLRTENLSDTQRQGIHEQLRQSKLETQRRKKQLRRRGYKDTGQKDNEPVGLNVGLSVREVNNISNIIVSYIVEPRDEKISTVTDFMRDAKTEVTKLMTKHNDNRRVQLILKTKLQRDKTEDNNITLKETLTRTNRDNIISPTTDVDELYDILSTIITTHFINKEHEGSGWTLDSIIDLEVKFYENEDSTNKN